MLTVKFVRDVNMISSIDVIGIRDDKVLSVRVMHICMKLQTLLRQDTRTAFLVGETYL